MATVMGILILWFLVTLDSSFVPEVPLLGANEVLLSAKAGKENTILTDKELDLLQHYGVPSVQVVVEAKEGEAQEPSKFLSLPEIRDVAKTHVVRLYKDVQIETRVTKELIEKLKDNKTLDEPISFVSGGVDMLGNYQVVEREFNDGKNDVRLRGEVSMRTWWRKTLFSVPLIQVEVSRGNIVIVALAILAFYGLFRFSNRPRNADFLIETESELKKVDWSTKGEVYGSTKVVLLLTVVFLVLMTVYDFFYQGIMTFLKRACFPGAR
jgi:preprotein translocase SecE subunit